MIFKRKKKKLENFDTIGLINDLALPLTPFVDRITTRTWCSFASTGLPANARSSRAGASSGARTALSRRGEATTQTTANPVEPIIYCTFLQLISVIVCTFLQFCSTLRV